MVVFALIFLMTGVLIGRLVYLMVFRSEYYVEQAKDLHERERDIKAARGQILDRNGVVLAANRTVCTISVIHSQVTDPETVIRVLAKELGMDEETVRKRVEKVSSIERVRTNVDKSVGDAIRAYGLAGVKVDEDYKRYYPYDTLASKVLGFTGGDNQGIIGLEVKYDDYLQGTNGKILTLTDARGVEIENAKKHNTPQEEMPKAIVVISDMEIDYCGNREWSFYDKMANKFCKAGYVIPNIIFWNVNSRHDVFHADHNRKGVQLASGQSVTVFKQILQNLGYNPVEAMENTINSERYDCITVE